LIGLQEPFEYLAQLHCMNHEIVINEPQPDDLKPTP